MITETLPQLHEENSVQQSYIMICHKGTLEAATLPLTQKKTHTKETCFFFQPSTGSAIQPSVGG